MDKKTKIFLWLISIITIISILITFYRMYISKDYSVIPISEEVSE